jgi:hypothetical protein
LDEILPPLPRLPIIQQWLADFPPAHNTSELYLMLRSLPPTAAYHVDVLRPYYMSHKTATFKGGEEPPGMRDLTYAFLTSRDGTSEILELFHRIEDHRQHRIEFDPLYFMSMVAGGSVVWRIFSKPPGFSEPLGDPDQHYVYFVPYVEVLQYAAQRKVVFCSGRKEWYEMPLTDLDHEVCRAMCRSSH